MSLQDLWHIKIQIIPVICTLLLCELPGIVRHLKKLYYVPIYFSVFPLRELNRDLAIYFGDDWFYGSGNALSPAELDALEKRINRTAIISTVLTVVVTPFVAGFVAAFFMPADAFAGFCLLFVLYKLAGLVHAAIGFKAHAVSNKKTMTMFWLVYLVYFGCFLTVFETAYEWASPFIGAGNWSGLWKELRSLLFIKIGVLGIIVTLVTAAATGAITDRKLRAKLRSKKQKAS